MPVLFIAKNRIGKSIGSRGLVADSKQTLACCFLSAALLLGLGLNYLYGIWWADPAAGLIIVVFFMKEGYEILSEGKSGCCGT
jgi:divalent metal cation (Fe/Co/Zn/Cd) transporter